MALKYCTLHKIAFNDQFESVCPQCSLAHSVGYQALDFDASTQKPIDASGKPIEPSAVVPAKI